MSNNSITINPGKNPILKFNVKWDLFTSKSVDLDATVVMINEYGSIVDAVYYNKLKSDCGTINHSGDMGSDLN